MRSGSAVKRNKHISQSELESYLWGAATLLRGYIDAGDYKQFIFPLLFYKRLCDVYDEELADALEESGGDQNMPHSLNNTDSRSRKTPTGRPPAPRSRTWVRLFRMPCGQLKQPIPTPCTRSLAMLQRDQQRPPAGPHAARAHRALQWTDAFACQLSGG